MIHVLFFQSSDHALLTLSASLILALSCQPVLYVQQEVSHGKSLTLKEYAGIGH
jgi:hypothetical protein